MLRVGLIGAGGIAGAHVNGYLANSDATRVVAIADPRAEHAQRRAARVGTPVELYDDYETMLAGADIDAVDICLPHHLHRDAIVATARAGKHILCEKPLCLTLEEARDVEAAVTSAGVTLMCAHNQLFSAPVLTAKRLLDEGAVGTVYEVRTTDCFVNDFDPETMGWRAHAATSGGGELIDTGYHPSYLAMHLAGSRPESVAAMLSTHRLTFMEGEDSAQVLVRFAGGVVGTIATSWAYARPALAERFSVVGSEGTLSCRGDQIVLARHGEQPQVIDGEGREEFEAQIAHFATSIAEGTAPLHSHREGTDVLRLILAAYESQRSGSVVELSALTP